MRKLFFISSLVTVSLFSLLTAAEYPGRYVRKQLKPTFFIPAKEIERSEKLPKFNYYPSQPKPKTEAPETQNIQVLEVINEIDMGESKPVADLPIPPDKVRSNTTEIDSRYLEYNKEELAKIPEYKQKYDDYMIDLKTIAKTGTAPENPRVTADLAKMSSNERLIVDDNFGLAVENVASETEEPVSKDTSTEIIY